MHHFSTQSIKYTMVHNNPHTHDILFKYRESQSFTICYLDCYLNSAKYIVLTSFTAVTPRQAREVHEGLEEVEDGPGDHNDVVDILKEHHHYRRVANTLIMQIKR